MNACRRVVPGGGTSRRGCLLLLGAACGAIGLLVGRAADGPGRSRVPRPCVVDPNTAPPEVLGALPRIGPALGRAIVAERRTAPFRSLDDLDRRVRGIGPATVAALRPYLRFEPAERPAAPSLRGSRARAVTPLDGPSCPDSSWSAPFQPAGDQPQAIEQLVAGLREGRGHQTLLGVTGSGKTFTMANVIAAAAAGRRWSCRTTRRSPPSSTASSRSSSRTTRSTTSSATTTTTSPKPTSRSATSTSRRTPRSTRRSTACGWRPPARWSAASDVIVVASVSCIYGLGSPEDYRKMMVRAPGRRDDRPRRDAAASWSTSSTTATTSPSSAASSASAATASRSGRRTRSSPSASSSGATRSRRSSIINPLSGEVARHAGASCSSTRPSTSSCRRSGSRRRSTTIEQELDERLEDASRSRASCSRPSGWPRGRGTTSR